MGFAHFRGRRSPLSGQMIGFLDDLFVMADHRSRDGEVALIKVVQLEAKAQDWGIERLITRDQNYQARGLYYKLAEKKTDWVLFEMVAK